MATKSPTPHPARLLSLRDVAQLLSCSPRTIMRYHDQGILPSPVRLNGRTLRWREKDLIRFVEEAAQ